MSIISDIRYENIHKGDKLLFARVLPKVGDYELLDLLIISVYDDYCTGTDTKTRQSYCFGKDYAKEVLFKDRKLAIQYLNDKKEENKNIKVAEE